MANAETSHTPDGVPPDLLPLLRRSGVLSDGKFTEIRAKVLAGDLPHDPMELARRLVRDKVLTEYQARRLLSNRPHGLIVGKYVILDRLGSGSMGRVYKAYHKLMGRAVALKIIAPEIVSNERVVARFQREMRLVARLDHPNVVRAFDADRSSGILYIVMEYVSGQSLGHRLRSRGPIPSAELIDYGAQAAMGLDHAHEMGIVHRDVKPSNLLLSDDNHVKVLDLGLGVLMEADEQQSFATADGVAVGTIDYMSPEQAMGKDVDGRSDLYSLGCAMYHLLTGRLPFPGDNQMDRLGKRINGRPVPLTDLRPDLSPGLVHVMDKLLANKPQDRYQRGSEVAEALLELLHKAPPPRPRSGVVPAAGIDIDTADPNAPPPEPPSQSDLEPEIIEVRPEYPGWFRPLADLAERSPVGALLAVAGILLAVLALGVGLGVAIR